MRVYRFCRGLLRWVLPRYFQWEVVGMENVPAEGPVLLAANHASFLDPPVVASRLERPVHFMARDTLFRFPGIGWFLRRLNAIPIDRDRIQARQLKPIMECVRAGGVLLLFPEGTRTRDGALGSARAGVGMLVRRLGAPVVPVRISGTYECYGRHVKWPRRGRVRVEFGPVLRFDKSVNPPETGGRLPAKALYQEIADEIMGAIGRLEGG